MDCSILKNSVIYVLISVVASGDRDRLFANRGTAGHP
jgi:hypothetical protein